MPKRTKQEMLIDELLKNNTNPEDILGNDGLLKQLTKSILERALESEITDHRDCASSKTIGQNSP